jgi:hypothetical protein
MKPTNIMSRIARNNNNTFMDNKEPEVGFDIFDVNDRTRDKDYDSKEPAKYNMF